jgi:hypothetical protein
MPGRDAVVLISSVSAIFNIFLQSYERHQLKRQPSVKKHTLIA